eukprot:1156373-Pelagomonas_calceolata.AAC.1
MARLYKRLIFGSIWPWEEILGLGRFLVCVEELFFGCFFERLIIRSVRHGSRHKKDYACQVWPRALRKGLLKGRASTHRPRGRGGTEVYTSKLASTMGPTTRLPGRPCPASSRPGMSGTDIKYKEIFCGRLARTSQDKVDKYQPGASLKDNNLTGIGIPSAGPGGKPFYNLLGWLGKRQEQAPPTIKKQAVCFKRSTGLKRPLPECHHMDSALDILSGCEYPVIQNVAAHTVWLSMTRHHWASL